MLKSGGSILDKISPKYFDESVTSLIKLISKSLITNIKAAQNKTIETRVFHDHWGFRYFSKFLSLFYLFSKKEKIEALRSLETVGLLEKSHNRSDELSGGQRQRVGIARAIIKKPLLLLADEPVASLDPKSSNLILSLLKKINQEFGTTILCNLQQVDLAKKYSDRVVGLIDGKIIFDEKSVNINEAYLKKIYT